MIIQGKMGIRPPPGGNRTVARARAHMIVTRRSESLMSTNAPMSLEEARAAIRAQNSMFVPAPNQGSTAAVLRDEGPTTLAECEEVIQRAINGLYAAGHALW